LNDEQMQTIERIIAQNAEDFHPPVPNCEHCGSSDTILVLKQEDPNYRQWKYSCSDGSPNFAHGSNTAQIVVAAGYACKACGQQFFSGFQKEVNFNMN
jgi:lysyl-tRNA synthetase class I